MTKIVTCEHCRQKINTDAMKEEVLWACVACGAPLPEHIEEYDPAVHGQWYIQGSYQPVEDQYTYETSHVTNDESRIFGTHSIGSSIVRSGQSVSMGYAAGEQPQAGDMFMNTADDGSLQLFTGTAWVDVSEIGGN